MNYTIIACHVCFADSVEVDATKVRTGSTIFVISTTDAENDQVVLTHTCTPAGTCPITLFDCEYSIKQIHYWEAESYLFRKVFIQSNIFISKMI